MKFTSFGLVLLTFSAWSYEKRDAKEYLNNIAKNLKKISADSSQKKNNCIADELTFQNVERTALHDFKQAFLQLNPKVIDAKFSGMFFNQQAVKKQGLNFLPLVKSPVSIISYFKNIKKANNIELIVTEMERQSDKSMQLKGRFDFSYFDKNQTRRIDRANIILDVAFDQKQSWKIKSVELINQQSLAALNPSFVEVTNEVGLANIPVYLRREAIRRGGYTLATGDYTGDNFLDMFVGTSQKAQLYAWNAKAGKFIQDTKTIKNLPTLAKAAAFSDYFNSGKQDLLVARFESVKDQRGIISEVNLFKNTGKDLKSINAPVVENSVVEDPMPIAVADFDGDQYLDLYIGYPGARDFTSLQTDSSLDLAQYKRQGVYLNDKKEKFNSNTKLLSAKDQFERLYPHSALAFDYDQDQDMDLVVIDDRGNLSPLYENVNNKLTQTKKTVGFGLDDFGMGTAFSDTNNNGQFEILTSSVNFYAATRLKNSCKRNWKEEVKIPGTSGLKMYSVTKEKVFTDVTKTAGLEFAGEGIGGVHFFDYNNDGFEDIYVANGLWTGSSQKAGQDFSSLFAILNLMDPKEYSLQQLRELGADTKSEIMDLLINFKGDINNPMSKTAGYGSPSLGGNQRNKLFLNNGKGGFVEVAFLEGVDYVADGYVVSTLDINRDNNMDLVLRNADPGVSEVSFPVVQVLKNQRSDNKSVVLQLKARTSNYDAVGAIVKATIGKQIFTRHLVAVEGTIQGERVLHFGLGQADKINQLEIIWPNGRKQYKKDVKPGRYTIQEDIKLSSIN